MKESNPKRRMGMLTNNILALVTTILKELTGEYFAMTGVEIAIYFEKK